MKYCLVSWKTLIKLLSLKQENSIMGTKLIKSKSLCLGGKEMSLDVLRSFMKNDQPILFELTLNATDTL